MAKSIVDRVTGNGKEWSDEPRKFKSYRDELEEALESYERQARTMRQGVTFIGEHPAKHYERMAHVLRTQIALIDNPEKVAQFAAIIGRKGGEKGGPARAKSLTAKRRSEIAKKAAQARWSKK